MQQTGKSKDLQCLVRVFASGQFVRLWVPDSDHGTSEQLEVPLTFVTAASPRLEADV